MNIIQSIQKESTISTSKKKGGKRGSSKDRPSSRKPPRIPTNWEQLPPDDKIERFDEMDLSDDLLDALEDMGFEKPTPIQALAIPKALEGRDLVGKAETGSGKTVAFGAPVVDRLNEHRVAVLALVLCPTRELALQVAEVFEELTTYKPLRTALIVGGEPMRDQIKELQKGCQIVVGTPGRVLDMVREKWLSLGWVEIAVLDEADEMLEIGFLDDVTEILEATPKEKQVLLFSATFPPPLMKIAEKYLKNPISMGVNKSSKAASTIEQFWMKVRAEDRPDAMIRILDQDEDAVTLAFCESRLEVERLAKRLKRLSYPVLSLHGGYDQPVRRKIMDQFRTGKIRALVATDVAARGLDISHVTRVLNYAVPRTLETYLHRIGRTGRAGAKGTALTFVSPTKQRDWDRMVAQGKLDITELETDDYLGKGWKQSEGRRERDSGRGGRERSRRPRSRERS
ncbi:MAG TPA: DEAD/DEAH box helicase [Planctomycetes bacterium]|nr:DEAD/DEAH box helicase [Planctomycetota bacterium]